MARAPPGDASLQKRGRATKNSAVPSGGPARLSFLGANAKGDGIYFSSTSGPSLFHGR